MRWITISKRIVGYSGLVYSFYLMRYRESLQFDFLKGNEFIKSLAVFFVGAVLLWLQSPPLSRAREFRTIRTFFSLFCVVPLGEYLVKGEIGMLSMVSAIIGLSLLLLDDKVILLEKTK